MTYQELVSKLKDTYQEKDASKISEHLAIQFNIQGEAEGALYLEIANGQLHVEPYEYYDRDILQLQLLICLHSRRAALTFSKLTRVGKFLRKEILQKHCC